MDFLFITYYIFIFLLGLSMGSFLNCVIYRLEKEEKLTGRSYCPQCKHRLIWIDLVPVCSFLFLKGKCRYCHKKISIQYPFVEIGTGILFLFIAQFLISHELSITNFQDVARLCFIWYVSCSMIIIFAYDIKHYIIPDKVLFPTIIITFLYQLIFNSTLIINYILAGLGVAAFFCVIFIVSKGTWIGFGDCKLAVLLGLLLGFPDILTGLFLAFLFGVIIGLILMYYKKKGLKSEVPFAPFLISGTFLAMLFGDNIVQWYLGLFL